MSLQRTQRALQLSRPWLRPQQAARSLSSTSQHQFPQTDPRGIADVEGKPMSKGQAAMVAVDMDSAPAESVEEYHPRHQPDYNATADHGTSTYSPVPRRVMNGSEPGGITPAAVLSGAPVDLQARTVRIYQPAKPATQSGTWGGHQWRLDWDPLPKGHRWENPLMGWQSSGDIMQGTNIKFKTKEGAIQFAEKQGYEYYVQEPQRRKVVPKAYANNFVHEPGPLKHIKTK